MSLFRTFLGSLGGAAPPSPDFIFTLETTAPNESITLAALNVGVYNATVDWGDGSPQSVITTYNDADWTHVYATPGVHTIAIGGTCPAPRLGSMSAADRAKVRTVDNFGTIGWLSLNSAFSNLTGVTSITSGNCDTSQVLDMNNAFQNCQASVYDLSTMDVSNVTTMRETFRGATATTLDLSAWNTASLTELFLTFMQMGNLTSLNLSGWNTSLVTDFTNAFYLCTSLPTLDLSSFNTANALTFASMFQDCNSLTDIVGVENFDITGLPDQANRLINFLTGGSIPTSRYDQLLINWEAVDPRNFQNVNFGGSTYTGGGAAAAARASLVSRDSWTITDGGVAP